jgi:hypothetical protein
MKTLKCILLFLVGTCIAFSCSKTDEFNGQQTADLKCGHARPVPTTITLPFKADFTGNYMENTGIDEIVCGVYPVIRVFNEGGGTAALLGRFTHHFDFCCNNETGEYPLGHMVAYFVAANGDTLFVACAGQVIPGRAEGQPEYVNSYFRDPFIILGGTGRFEGASGSGMTDDYNSDLDPYSHHHWAGTITLVKGKYPLPGKAGGPFNLHHR